MKKVNALPKLDNSQGKISCTNELIKEFTKAITPMAIPLIFNGYISDKSTHITGPNEKAKHAIKPKMPIKTKLAFMLVAASKIAPSFLAYILLPKASFISFLKSKSLV